MSARILWATTALVWLAPLACLAADPAQFDLPPIVACRDVTTAEFAELNPGERLWEVRFAVSVLARPANSGRLSQLLVQIDSPRRSLRVVDFAPRTTLTTDVQGVIRREHHAESQRSLDFHVKGGLPGVVDGEATGSSHDRRTTDEHVERLPPLALGVASGSTRRGSGVYFKLQPTTRSTLEGDHLFTLWLASRDSWSGDHLRVHCEAFGRDTSLVPVLDETAPWGDQDFVVAIYRSGDELGRRNAEELVRAEGELRGALARQRSAGTSRINVDLASEFTTFWRGRDGRPATAWFEPFVYGATPIPSAAYQRLPREVRDAAERFAAAKRNLSTASLQRLPAVR